MRKKGKHLNLEERVEIYHLKKLGYSVRKIGREIDRNHSVVSRETSRNWQRFSRRFMTTPLTISQKIKLFVIENKLATFILL